MGQYKKEILGLKNTLAKIITRQVKREFLAEKITARERPKDKSERRLRNKAHEGIGGTGEQGARRDGRRHMRPRLTAGSGGTERTRFPKRKWPRFFQNCQEIAIRRSRKALKSGIKKNKTTSGSIEANSLNKPKDQKSNVLKAAIRELTLKK